MRASKQRRVPSALIRPALWFCACNLLAASLSAQCTNPTQVPDGTYTSGDHSQVNNNALSATNFVVSGGASATFSAGNCIQLNPGFHANAIGATVPTTFHAWVDIAPTAVSVVPNSPPQNPPLSQSFTWTVSSPSGHSNLSHVFALFNGTSNSTANACYIHYDASSNLVYLADNTSTTWLGGFAPSSSGSIGNSQCTVFGTGSSPNPTSSGTQLGLTLNVTFNAASFSGTQNEYLYALDGSGVYTGWQPMGTWTVPAPPAPDFTLTATSTNYYVPMGSSTPSYTLIVTPQNGFNSPVSFSMSWPMYGCSNPTFNPGLVTGAPWTSTATMSCYETLQNGYWTTVTATGGGKSHQLNLYLYVGQSQQQYYLTTAVSPSAGGYISPGSGWYNSGSYVTISATPASGYQFSGWTGVDSSSGPTGYVTMNSNRNVTANFSQTTTQYQLTTNVSPSGSGSLSFNPSCCTYNAGTQVTITASAASGYQFSGWSGVDSSNGTTGYVTMNGNRSITATFSQIATQYQLTTNVSPSGTGTISPASGLYNVGSVIITANPNSGYAFSSFTGTYSGTTNPLTINLTGAGTITANFVAGYTISGQVTLSGGGGVSGVSIYASGSQNASATTDANGMYTLPALAAGGSYTVTASKSGYLLSAAQTFNNLGSNQTASFTATPTLSINGGGSTAEVAPSTNVSMAFNLYDQAGANDIGWAQFYLADGSGGAHCYGDWGRPNALDLYDGDTGATSGFGITQSDTFCSVSLASITNSPTDPTEVTVVLNFTFNPGTDGTYSVLTQINYGSGPAGPWQALGTLTIDPAREPVLSTPTDEPPPDPAPVPVSPPAVSGSTTNCNDISGTWTDGANTFSYSQSGQSVTGTITEPDPYCPTPVTWQVQGQATGDGVFTLTDYGPSTDACGNTVGPITATVTVTISSCSTAQVSGSGSTGTNPTFRAQALPLANAATTSWTRTSNPPGISMTVDVMAGKISTQLSGQNKAGNLAITVNSSQGQQTPLPAHASAQSGNSFNDSFRLSLPVGQYGNVVAAWDTTSVTVPVAFYVVGNTRLTQYNTPYEQNCHDNPQTAYVINKIDKAADGYCYWKVVQLGRQFVTQVITNGTGVIGTNEIVKAYNAGARNVCDIPTGGSASNSFFSVDSGGNPITKIKGSHNSVLSDATGTVNSFNNNNPAAGSIAVLPNSSTKPTAPAFPFVFGDQLLLIDQNDANDRLGPRSAEDYCPGCGPGSFSSPAVAHVDVYSSRQSCGTGSDYNNGAPFVTIRLR